MGENVLQAQVKSFKKGADRTLESMSTPTLFDRPDIISITYTAAPIDGCAISEGDHLDAHASGDGRSVVLAKGHVSVGRIEGDGSNSLLDALRHAGSSGVVPMRVTTISPISGFIKAVIAKREGSDGS